ncbi:MAG TPA: hypothetical protein VHM90_03000, partial [Phycisphaerae bacterium]|nr:hypothetical protein [Phycisphaerae bacterium]
MIRPDPDKIIVPRTHGEILAEPVISTLRPALLPSLPDGLGSQRNDARAQLLGAAMEWAKLTGATPPTADAAEKAWVITGHQVEFYHPGVWAKVLAADAVARRSDAVAFDLLVDHDVIDHIGFDVPVERGNGGWGRTREDIAVNPAALPAESLQAPPLNDFLQW